MPTNHSSIRLQRRARWFLPITILVAASTVVPWILYAWLGNIFGPKANPRHALSSRVVRTARADDLDGVTFVEEEDQDVSISDFSRVLPKEKPKPEVSDDEFDAVVPSTVMRSSVRRSATNAARQASGEGGKKSAGRGWLRKRSKRREKLDQNAALEQWLAENGVWVRDRPDWGLPPHACAMSIETKEETEGESSGRGLVTRRLLDQGEEITNVPVTLVITKQTAVDYFGEEIIVANMSDFTAVAMQLVVEQFVKKEDSFWRPYLDVMPDTDEIGAAWTWSDEDLDTLLPSTSIHYLAPRMREKVEDDFYRVRDLYFKEYPDKFPEDSFTMENWIWAYAIIFSRAVRLQYPDSADDFVGLVPYIDLLNHSPRASSVIKAERLGPDIPFNLREKDNVVQVKADKYYEKYEQVYISYGAKSNSQLLLLYGFCLERNIQDTVDINFAYGFENTTMRAAKERLVRRYGFKWTYPLYRETFAQEMFHLARLAVLEPDDIDDFEEDPHEDDAFAALLKMDIRNPIDESSERRSLEFLKSVLQDRLDYYPTTIEEDERVIRDRAMFALLPKKSRNALRLRLGEKIILTTSINALKRKIATVGKIGEFQQERYKRLNLTRGTLFEKLGLEYDPVIRANNIEELLEEMGVSLEW